MSKTRVDFTIVSRPDYIVLECPHCGDEIEVEWGDVPHDEYWDLFSDIKCPDCGETIQLGNWSYD